MKSLAVLSASLLVSLALAQGTAHACSMMYIPNGLSQVGVVGSDTLPLDSGIVLSANYRKTVDEDPLATLKIEVATKAGDDVAGKATLVSRSPFSEGTERLVIRWVPDAPFVAGEDVNVTATVTREAQPGEPAAPSPVARAFRVSETKLADLVAPRVTIAGHVSREETDPTLPLASCTIAEDEPGMCGPGRSKGSTLSFPSRVRNVSRFLVDVTRTSPSALDAFVTYTTGDNAALSPVARQEVSVGEAPAGSEHCIEVTASTLVGGVVRTAKACATVPDTAPVTEARQKEYLAGATRSCATGSITPENVAEEAGTASGGTSGASGSGCNASGHEAPAPVAAIALACAVVALRRRAKKARSSAT